MNRLLKTFKKIEKHFKDILNKVKDLIIDLHMHR